MGRQTISAMALMWALAACAPPAADESASLAGTSWTVTALQGQAPLDGRGGAPSLAFADDGGVSGSTGCNRFFGAAEIAADGTLSIGDEEGGLGTTKMACTPLLMQQEMRMLGVLRDAARFEIAADGGLSLIDDGGAVVLAAVPAPSEPSGDPAR